MAPLLAPIGAALWNFFAEFIIGIINAIPLLGINISFTPIQFVTVIPDYYRGTALLIITPNLNITDTILAVTNFLNALRMFLIESATGGNGGVLDWLFGSTIIAPTLKDKAKLWG
jgi:hypothetical protein